MRYQAPSARPRGSAPGGTIFSSPLSSFTSATQCIRVPASCGASVSTASTVLPLPTPLLTSDIRAEVGGVRSSTCNVTSSVPRANARFGRTVNTARSGPFLRRLLPVGDACRQKTGVGQPDEEVGRRQREVAVALETQHGGGPFSCTPFSFYSPPPLFSAGVSPRPTGEPLPLIRWMFLAATGAGFHRHKRARAASVSRSALRHAADQKTLVSAGLSADQLHLRALDAQRFAQRLDQRLVGPAILRRRRDGDLERPACSP